MLDAIWNPQSSLASYGGRGIVPYEVRLSQSAEWALTEGSLFFEGRGSVQESLARIVKRLEDRGVPYAIAGGMALFLHGYRRFTEDVDILVTREGLQRIHAELDGLGYLRPFAGSKNLRDTVSGVKIEFLIAGEYPGDGRPKSIAFPNPDESAEVRNGMRVLDIAQIVSLKIASGITGQGRSKDLADVEELIKALSLPEALSETLHPYSRERYLEIWRGVHGTPKRYLLLWPKTERTSQARTMDELIEASDSNTDVLIAMHADGVALEAEPDPARDHFRLVTFDRAAAGRHGLQEETEFWGIDDKQTSNQDSPGSEAAK